MLCSVVRAPQFYPRRPVSPQVRSPAIPTATAKIPPPPLSSEQRRRREDNRYRARERQLLYPRAPGSTSRITRESPRKMFPTLPEGGPATRSVRVVCENPQHPNAYLYLLQYTDAKVSTYAFHMPDGSRWRDATFPSIFEACVTAARAGYLDASW